MTDADPTTPPARGHAGHDHARGLGKHGGVMAKHQKSAAQDRWPYPPFGWWSSRLGPTSIPPDPGHSTDTMDRPEADAMASVQEASMG